MPEADSKVRYRKRTRLVSVSLMGLLDFLRLRQRDRGAPEPATGGGSLVEVELRAKRPGDLTGLGRLELPEGRLITSFDNPDAGPVAWLSTGDGDQARLWVRLVGRFASIGLWPVVVETLAGDASRPWESGEFGGPVGPVAEAGEVLGPRGAAVPARASHTRLVELRSPAWAAQIMLVPVTRPADVPARIGWDGPVNHGLNGADVSAMLRSWEDRFGAVLTGIGFNTLTLTVPHPPTEPDEIRQVMHEIYAFCPDLVDQGVGEIGGLDPMVRGREWIFWWD